MTPLSTLLYVSQSLISDRSSIEELLTVSRDINLERSITGVLVLHAGRFLQVLEGHPDDVDLIYSRIERDTRHENVRLLLKGPIPARRFGSWSMAFLKPDRIPDVLGATSFDDLRVREGKSASQLLGVVETMVTSERHPFQQG